MSRLQLGEHGGQRFYACHWDGSFGPRRSLEYVAEVLAARVALPLRISSRPSLRDSSSPVRARVVWTH